MNERTEIDRLRWIVRQLRQHCAWTAGLSHQQLTQYMIEEAYEVVETIEAGEWSLPHLGAELADVLFQVVLHAQLAAEDERFDFDDVAAVLSEKMIRRNPHVFTATGQLLPAEELDLLEVEGIATQWETIKNKEKSVQQESCLPQNKTKPGPALATAQLQVARNNRAGTPSVAPVELSFSSEQELADHLYSVVIAAENAGLDAEKALRIRNRF